jgi:hypothetical protein
MLMRGGDDHHIAATHQHAIDVRHDRITHYADIEFRLGEDGRLRVLRRNR